MEYHLSNSPRGNLETNSKHRTPKEAVVLPQVRENPSEDINLRRNTSHKDCNNIIHLATSSSFPYDTNVHEAGVVRESQNRGFPIRRNPLLNLEHSRRSINSFLATVESETMETLHERLGNSQRNHLRPNKSKQKTGSGMLGKLSPSLPLQTEPVTSHPRVLPSDENFRIYSHGVMVYEESKKCPLDGKSPGSKPKEMSPPKRRGIGQSRWSPRLEDDGKVEESGCYEDFMSWCRYVQLKSD